MHDSNIIHHNDGACSCLYTRLYLFLFLMFEVMLSLHYCSVADGTLVVLTVQ